MHQSAVVHPSVKIAPRTGEGTRSRRRSRAASRTGTRPDRVITHEATNAERFTNSKTNQAEPDEPTTRTETVTTETHATEPPKSTTRYGIANGLHKVGSEIQEREICHLHRTRAAADSCERSRAPWYNEHDLVEVAQDETGRWTVTNSSSAALAQRA